MKRTITHRQLEEMISDCLGQVLRESCQPQRPIRRQTMNESQMREYIQNIINEELDNEGFLGGLKGMGAAVGQKVGNAPKRFGGAIQQGAQKVGQVVGNTYNNVKQGVQNQEGQFAQAYRNGSALQDLQKVKQTMQKYEQLFMANPAAKNGYYMMNSGLNTIIKAVQSGEQNY